MIDDIMGYYYKSDFWFVFLNKTNNKIISVIMTYILSSNI